MNYAGFALQYPDGQLAGKDYMSGGYPFVATSIGSVWVTTREELERYLRNSNPEGFKIVRVKLDIERIV